MEFFDEDSESEWSEDDQEMIGLFSSKKFNNIREVMTDARDNYNFDFYAFAKQHSLDQYGCIRMINYIRSEIQKKTNPETLVLSLLPKLVFLEDDRYYKPVLENDSVLFGFDLKDGSPTTNQDDDDEKTGKYSSPLSPIPESAKETEDIHEIQPAAQSEDGSNEYMKLLHKIESLTQMVRDRSTSSEQREIDSLLAINQKLTDQVEHMKRSFRRVVLEEGVHSHSVSQKVYDSRYFDSYARTSIHEEMLRDTQRTCAYRDFIMQNGDVFKDKVVMDIGCGTGVLSIFAAKSGAKHVIAVDMSDIAKRAKMIIKNNGFEGKITVIQDKLENIKHLPNGIDKVDVLISEWMGYFLLYESMVSSVIFARDHFLKMNNGVDGMSGMNRIFPNEASLFMAGFDFDAMNLKFWRDECYDIDMSVMYQRPKTVSEPLIIAIESEYIRTQSTCFKVERHSVPSEIECVCECELFSFLLWLR